MLRMPVVNNCSVSTLLSQRSPWVGLQQLQFCPSWVSHISWCKHVLIFWVLGFIFIPWTVSSSGAKPALSAYLADGMRGGIFLPPTYAQRPGHGMESGCSLPSPELSLLQGSSRKKTLSSLPTFSSPQFLSSSAAEERGECRTGPSSV